MSQGLVFTPLSDRFLITCQQLKGPHFLCFRIQLPDLRYVDCTVDFSVKTFNASVGMCRDLGLRHPEELSLCKPLDPEHLRQNYQVCWYFYQSSITSFLFIFFFVHEFRLALLPLTNCGTTHHLISHF